MKRLSPLLLLLLLLLHAVAKFVCGGTILTSRFSSRHFLTYITFNCL